METLPAAGAPNTAKRLNYFLVLVVIAACMYLPYVVGLWQVGSLDTEYKRLPIIPGFWASALDLRGRGVQAIANGIVTSVALFGLSWLGSRSLTALGLVALPTLFVSVFGAILVSLVAAADGIR